MKINVDNELDLGSFAESVQLSSGNFISSTVSCRGRFPMMYYIIFPGSIRVRNICIRFELAV